MINTDTLTLDEQRGIVLEDLKGKIARRDWHGVADAAMDLRDLDAYEQGQHASKPPAEVVIRTARAAYWPAYVP